MKRLLWGALASSVLVSSCGGSGQTGSPDCAWIPRSCECDTLAGKSLVQATVLAIDVGSVRLEVEQVLNPSASFDESDAHLQVQGVLVGSVACIGSAVAPAQMGDVVFATFFPYARQDPNFPRNVGDVVVSPWSDPVDLGNQRPIAVSQAIALADPTTCDQQYPSPSAHCNDTSGFAGCSLSDVPASRSSTAWWSLFAFIALGAALARRRPRIR